MGEEGLGVGVGEFHCPMGSPYPGHEACIDCGGCMASTREEIERAISRITEYLRERAERPLVSKKIAICGKGGVGKSTVTALLATTLAEAGKTVLAIDADESNPGLYRSFGFDGPPEPLACILDRFSPNGAGRGWLKQDRILVQEIPRQFVVEKDGVKLVMVGKVEDPFTGCACPLADAAREFVGKLVIEDELVVIDNEAGVESFGRGLERNTDTVLIVVEPSVESLALAGKIDYMAQAMGVGKVGAILNKVPTKEIEDKMVERLRQKSIRYFGAIYLDGAISEASFEGAPLGPSSGKEDMRTIARILIAGA